MYDLKSTSTKWHEAFGTDRLPSVYEEVLADDFRALFFGHGWVTREQYMAGDQEFAAAFENVVMKVESIAQEGDTVFCRMTWTGRQVGEVLGLQPSGREFEVFGFCEDTYRDGKVVEHIPLFDTDSLQRQLTAE